MLISFHEGLLMYICVNMTVLVFVTQENHIDCYQLMNKLYRNI